MSEEPLERDHQSNTTQEAAVLEKVVSDQS
jgi:hypothetical protein